VARRVAQEMGCEVGQDVGYCVRFEERVSRRTRILYLTGVANHIDTAVVHVCARTLALC
jgi:hypothetical protein